MSTRFTTLMSAGLMAVALGGGAFAEVMTPPPPAAEQEAAQPQPRRGGPMMGGRGPGFGSEFRGLDLTDDQRAQLRKIREAHQAEFRTAGEKVRTARQGMRALIEADAIDETAIRARSTDVAAAEADLAILNAKVRAESMQILTAEQQAKLKERRASRQEQTRPRRRS